LLRCAGVLSHHATIIAITCIEFGTQEKAHAKEQRRKG
jgi:hypothetical protein